MDTPFVSSTRTSSCQTNAVASTWSALRRSATEVSSERAQAAARQIGQEAPGNVTRTDHVEREEAGGQRAKERLLESSEMDDRRRGLLREARGLVGQRTPGDLSVERGPHHVFGDASNPGNGGRNLLAIWKRDQVRMRVRDCVADLGPADFKEVPSRRGGRGLAVDHQHLHLRERLGMTAQHHSPQPNLIRPRFDAAHSLNRAVASTVACTSGGPWRVSVSYSLYLRPS